MSGYSQKRNEEARSRAYLAILDAANAAEDDKSIVQMQFWIGLADVVGSMFPRSIGAKHDHQN